MVSISKVMYLLAFVAVMATVTVAWKHEHGEEDNSNRAIQNLALRTLMAKAFGKRDCVPSGYYCTKDSDCCPGLGCEGGYSHPYPGFDVDVCQPK